MIAARDISEGQIVKLVAPDGDLFSFEVLDANPVERGKRIRLILHPVGFPRQYTETRVVGPDRKLEVVR